MVFEGRKDSAVIAPKQTRAGHEVPPRPLLSDRRWPNTDKTADYRPGA